jgi:hypothetical protein
MTHTFFISKESFQFKVSVNTTGVVVNSQSDKPTKMEHSMAHAAQISSTLFLSKKADKLGSANELCEFLEKNGYRTQRHQGRFK